MIRNITKNTIISGEKTIMKGIFGKARGLMLSKRKSLVFSFENERIVPLHMLFVFFPIDVIFLDKNKKVAEIKESFRPFTFYNPKKKAMYVIEVPAGFVKRSKTNVGDKIGF